MFVEGSVVLVLADAQLLAGGEQHIIAAVAGDASRIDQIGFVDAQKLAALLAQACLHHVEFLVKRIAAVCGDDVGAPPLRGEIPNLIDRDMEVFRSDIIRE